MVIVYHLENKEKLQQYDLAQVYAFYMHSCPKDTADPEHEAISKCQSDHCLQPIDNSHLSIGMEDFETGLIAEQTSAHSLPRMYRLDYLIDKEEFGSEAIVQLTCDRT